MIYNVYTLIMKTTIAKWGNSLAVRLPSKALERLNAKVGEDFFVDVKDNKLMLSPISSTKITIIPIKQLIKGFDGKEKEIWGDMESVGEEIW